MGNSVPVGDERIERMTELLNLSKSDIAGFWKVFQKFDREREGVISMDVFFSDICQEKRNLFGDAIFELIDTEDTNTIEFGEFVQGVCTFAMFQVPDVLRFSFFIFDKDKNGYIDKDELELFVSTLHAGGVAGNIMHALHSLDFNGDGKFDFMEFSAMHEKFPTVLYPAFRLQQQMCANILGAQWWKKKQAMLQGIKEDENRKLEKERKAEWTRAMKSRKMHIRAELGVVNYYRGFFQPDSFIGRKRDYLERMNPEPLVLINKSKEIVVQNQEPIKKVGDEQYVAKDDEDNDPNRRAGE
jgi:Ca2+-binding EF-hand superfamily protein